jgi:hypothetical protein
LKGTDVTEVKEASVNDDMEEIIDTPGAAISGFMTPSYLGPILENEAIAPPAMEVPDV